jgi:hypothetical protein
MGVTGTAGAAGGGEVVAVGIVGGWGGKVVGGVKSLAAGAGVGGGSPAVVVCATASEVSDRQTVKVERA